MWRRWMLSRQSPVGSVRSASRTAELLQQVLSQTPKFEDCKLLESFGIPSGPTSVFQVLQGPQLLGQENQDPWSNLRMFSTSLIPINNHGPQIISLGAFLYFHYFTQSKLQPRCMKMHKVSELRLLFNLTHQKKDCKLHDLPKFCPRLSVVLYGYISCIHFVLYTCFCSLKGEKGNKGRHKKAICPSSSNLYICKNVSDYRDRVWTKLSLILVRYIGNWHLLSTHMRVTLIDQIRFQSEG